MDNGNRKNDAELYVKNQDLESNNSSMKEIMISKMKIYTEIKIRKMMYLC